MKRSICLVLILLTTLTVNTASAQEKPAAGVELQLLDDQGKVVATTTTKKDGSFSFKVSSEGGYTLNVMGGGVQGALVANAKSPDAEKGKRKGQTSMAAGTVLGHENEMELEEYKLVFESDDVSIVSPRDAASGQSSGKRTHGTQKILKRMDKATPLLFKTASGGGGLIKGTVTYDLKTMTK